MEMTIDNCTELCFGENALEMTIDRFQKIYFTTTEDELEKTANDIFAALGKTNLIKEITQRITARHNAGTLCRVGVIEGEIRVKLIYKDEIEKELSLGALFSTPQNILKNVDKAYHSSVGLLTSHKGFFDVFKTSEINSYKKLLLRFDYIAKIDKELSKAEKLEIMKIARRFKFVSAKELALFKIKNAFSG